MAKDSWTESSLVEELDAVERDAHALVAGLSEENGAWRRDPNSWSVAECLDHLAVSNATYLRAMRSAADQARRAQSSGDRSTRPGWIGRWFIRTLEPPVRPAFKMQAPDLSRPRKSPQLADAYTRFLDSHREARSFLREYAEIDFTRTRFRNPFVRALPFSLATCLHIIVAHERRHLWQAWRVRKDREIGVSAMVTE